MYGPAIPRMGISEMYAAKHYARFKVFPDAYEKALRGRPIPPHVFSLAARFEKQRFWEIRSTEGGKYHWWEVLGNEGLTEAPAPEPKAEVKAVPSKSDKKAWWDSIIAEAAAITAAKEKT